MRSVRFQILTLLAALLLAAIGWRLGGVALGGRAGPASEGREFRVQPAAPLAAPRLAASIEASTAPLRTSGLSFPAGYRLRP